MRVLLVNTSETIGGAAVAAGRLLRALCNNGIEAEMLVRDKQTDNPRVLRLPHRRLMRLRFIAERLGIFLRNGLTRRGLFAIDDGRCGADITRLEAFRRADVIHLHWVNQGMLSLADVRRILASGKRVVWTMHDMWPFTGSCHHAAECTRWQSGCGRCPQLHRSNPHDISRTTFRRKERTYGVGNLAFAGCSNWLTDLARTAPLCKGHRVESIPNPLDTDHFCPAPRTEARRRLFLPDDRRLVLFVAHKATNPMKGIDYLREALDALCRRDASWRERLAVVVVGQQASTLEGSFAVPLFPFEFVSSPAVMADLYRAADLLAVPTLQDNLPNTVAEAMACATPVAAFRVGGLPQMVDDGVNGRLVAYRDSNAMADAVGEILTSPRYAGFCTAARRKAVSAYSEQAVAARYRLLYEGKTP